MITISPGVYTTEKDFSLYAPQLATSILGMVGTASKGPTNTLTLITDEATLVKTFGQPSATHLGLYSAIRYLRRGRALKFVRVANYDLAATVSLRGRTGIGQPVADAATVEAQTTGSWGNNLKVKVEASTYFSGAYKIKVLENNIIVETFDNCTVGTPSDANYWITKVNANSSYVQLSAADDTQLLLEAETRTLTGGDDGAPVDASDIIGIAGSPPSTPTTGLQIFRNAETIDLNLLAVPGCSLATVVSEIIDICESRGDCLGLIDPPVGLTVQEVVDWHNGVSALPDAPVAALSSSYAAVFYPWLKVYDAFSDTDIWVPPSGHVAGVVAHTDQVADPWWAPAGLNRALLSDVIEVEHSPNQGERDYMYGGTNSVNPICEFYGQGIVIWGSKTLSRLSSATNRINIRRLVLHLRKVIATAARLVINEPNDEMTWRMLTNMIEPNVENVKARRGVYDYRVICDETTNTSDSINANEVRGKVLLQPTKTAETINIEFTLLPAGANFEEFE